MKQLGAIDAFAEKHPNSRVWLKADAKDLNVALQESQTGVWNGDAALRPEVLQKLRAEYDSRTALLGTARTAVDSASFEQTISGIVQQLEVDVVDLVDGHAKAVQLYMKKKLQPGISETKLKEMNWNMAEYLQLLERAQSLKGSLSRAVATTDWQTTQQHLAHLTDDYAIYLRNLFKKKRTPASHIFVVMISEERRQHKPYAIPILYVPCQVLRDQQVRDLLHDVKTKLKEKGLQVVGMYYAPQLSCSYTCT